MISGKGAKLVAAQPTWLSSYLYHGLIVIYCFSHVNYSLLILATR